MEKSEEPSFAKATEGKKSMNIQHEKELVQRAKKDPQAFGVIFEEYYDPIFGYILKRTGNVTAAQDIASETFFKALDRLWQFRWRGLSISSWLYRIATNEINQYFRKEKKHRYSLEALLDQAGIELADEHDMARELMEQEEELARAAEWQRARKLLHQLPEKYQAVLSLRFFEDKKITEIAEILGKKQGTVKSLLSRGTSMLRAKMTETQPHPPSRVVESEEAISPASKKS